jgi:hypothetical protein
MDYSPGSETLSDVSDKVPKPHVKFSAADDERLRRLVATVGIADWAAISKQMEGKNPRQCKERWYNYLSPHLNTSDWSPAEDALLLQKHRELGGKWAKIARFLPHRTDSMAKNRFHKLDRQNRQRQELATVCDQMLWTAFLKVQLTGNAICQAPRQEPAPVRRESIDEQTFHTQDAGWEYWDDLYSFETDSLL